MHALNSFWFSTCFNDSAFCFKLNCSTNISFIFMPRLCSTRISKNLGLVSFVYYLGQDGIGQVVIWGKLESDKLSWDKLTCNVFFKYDRKSRLKSKFGHFLLTLRLVFSFVEAEFDFPSNGP